MVNALTIDLEPWMAFYDDVPLEITLDNGHLVKATWSLLDILDESDVRATFFVLGIIYEWFPDLVEDIRSRGHEISFHGYLHNDAKRDLLRGEIKKSRVFIRRYGIRGFRAPKMRIFQDDLEILRSAGFLYDSSTYGSFSPKISISGIKEIPVSTYPVNNTCAFPRTLRDAIRSFELPFGSGLFVGLLNSRILDKLIRSVNKEGKPVIMFIHPWQLTGVPFLSISGLVDVLKIPYLVKISKKKMRYLLRNHTFSTIQSLLEETNQ